jgi:hypothetical protein
MDEQINKKGVIFVFLSLILIFLFIYKGIILSGDEYAEALAEYKLDDRGFGLKKRKGLGGGDVEDVPVNSNQNKLMNTINQLENIKLELNALGHSIKTKKIGIIEMIEKNVTDVESIVDVLKSRSDEETLDSLLENLNVNINSLRNITYDN